VSTNDQERAYLGQFGPFSFLTITRAAILLISLLFVRILVIFEEISFLVIVRIQPRHNSSK